MKKIIFSVMLLSACTGEQMASWIPEGDKSATTNQARLHACVLDEARVKVQDGSVWTLGVKESASEISSACIKKLALQSAGLDTQATTDAQNTLQSLMNLKNSLTGAATAE